MAEERIAHYQISGKIGAGGMGEVHRATDTKLGREVAIKVLPPQFSQDAQRLRRFEKETRSLAALNHPNILVIHDSGVHSGQPYFVSELLEGQSLREELSHGPIPVRKALDYAVQITQGLAAAHDKELIHRDLKPENLFITRDGIVKILDFGLVKLREQSREEAAPLSHAEANPDAPTLTAGQTTEPGRTMGTPSYMSPEQVRGKPVDPRSDIFALGCVFHEMLTGERCFERDSAPEIMTAILKDEVADLSTIKPGLPPALNRIVGRCLEKLPEHRFQSALDLGFALENSGTDSSGTLATSPESPNVTKNGSQWVRLAWGLGGLALGVFIFSMIQKNPPLGGLESTSRQPLRKIEIHLPGPSNLDSTDEEIRYHEISPDGQKFAYINADGLWLRWLDRVGSAELLVESGGSRFGSPIWAPQSDEVAFLQNSNLYRQSIAGGEKKLICATESALWAMAAGGTWTQDDRIIFTFGNSDIFEVSAHGGIATVALRRDEDETGLHFATPLPKGKGILMVRHSEEISGSIIQAWSPGEGRTTLFEVPEGRIGHPVYSPSGHILFDRSGKVKGVWAFGFSLSDMKRTGPEFLVSDRGTHPSLSLDGTLLINVSEETLRQLVWVDRSGQITDRIGPPQRGMNSPRLSPDGRQIATSVRQHRDWNIWITDTRRGLTNLGVGTDGTDIDPFWFPDGETIAFRRWSNASPKVYIQHLHGDAGEEEQFMGFIGHLSPSGRFYLLHGVPDVGLDYTYVPINVRDSEPTPFPQSMKDLRPRRMRLSPGDQWLAFSSTRSGENEVYIADFPSFERRRQVSQGPVENFEWHPNDKKLYYTLANNTALMMVEISDQADVDPSVPVEVFKIPPEISTLGFQVAADEERFLMLKNIPDPIADNGLPKPKILMIENWFEEFRDQKNE